MRSVIITSFSLIAVIATSDYSSAVAGLKLFPLSPDDPAFVYEEVADCGIEIKTDVVSNARLIYYFSILPIDDDFSHATIMGTGRYDVLAIKGEETLCIYDSDKPNKGFMGDNSGYWFDFGYQVDKFNWLLSDELPDFDPNRALDVAEFIVFFYYGIDLIETFSKIRDEVYIKQYGYYSKKDIERFSYFNVSPLKHKITTDPFRIDETEDGYTVTVESLDESFYHSDGTGLLEVNGLFVRDDGAEPRNCTWTIDFDKSGVITNINVDPIPEMVLEALDTD